MSATPQTTPASLRGRLEELLSAWWTRTSGVSPDSYVDRAVGSAVATCRQELKKVLAETAGSAADETLRAAAPQLLAALENLLEHTERPPDRDCSCHISPPCPDCTDHASIREAIQYAEEAIAKAEGRAGE